MNPQDQATSNGPNGSSNNIMRFFANLPGAATPPQQPATVTQPQQAPTGMPPGLFANLPSSSPQLPGLQNPMMNQSNLAGQHLMAMLGRGPSSSQISTQAAPSTAFPGAPGVGYSMGQPQFSSPIAIMQGQPLTISSDQLRASTEMRTQVGSVPRVDSQPQTQISSSPIAASPLKKSISATLETPNVTPQGVYLSGNNVTISRSEHKGRSKKPLEVNQITIYSQPDVSFKIGSSITVNNHFICYVVKQNLIRTIQISTSAKALLKGHTSDICDLRFAENGANRFVSADVGGSFVVWDLKETGRVKNESTGVEEPVLEFARTLVVDVPEGSGVSVVRAIWNPVNPGILATAYSDNYIVLWSVALLKQSATSVADATGGHFELRRPATADLSSFASTIGVLAVINVGSPANDLSFSADGSSLAVGCSDGFVRVYSSRGVLSHEWQPHGGAPVYAAQLLQAPQSAGLMLTGGLANDQLCLWDARSYSLLQTLTFEPASTNEPGPIKSGQRVSFDRSGQFLAVAHNNQPYLHIFHLLVPSNPATAPSFDYMTEFGLGAADDKGAPSPVLSFVVTNHKPHAAANAGTGSDDLSHIQIFSAQAKYIQMYRIHAAQCYPGPQFEDLPAPSVSPVSNPPSAPVSMPATPSPPPAAVNAVEVVAPAVAPETAPAPAAEQQQPVAQAEQPAPSTPAITDSSDAARTESESSVDSAASADSQPKQDRSKQKKDKQQKPKQKDANANTASPAGSKYKAKNGKGEQTSENTGSTAPAPAPVPASTNGSEQQQEQTPQTVVGRVAKNNKRGRTKSQLDADTSRDGATQQQTVTAPISAGIVVSIPPAAVSLAPEPVIPAPEPVSTEGLDSNAALMLQRLEKMMKQQNDYFVAQLERQRREFERTAEERQQALLQAFVSSLNANLEQLIQKQIKANFQSLGKIMSQSMESMLSVSLQDSFKKAVKEGLKESSQSQAEDIAGRITDSVGQAFRTHFANVLVPSFERALQSMFTQIANTLEQGIQQYTAQLAAASVSAGSSSSSGAGTASATTQLGTAVTTRVDISDRMNRSLVDTQSKLVSTLLDVVGRARSASSGSRPSTAPVANKPPATLNTPAVATVWYHSHKHDIH
eukprot:TRINITY_DN4617_c0_g3_i2.p1 TRINITY_DN4617_c0_g3~~TRINITY_DN4617_c0_g3_i2.p1  ORF type:complete len:1114 (+),score=308.93 TRINITY_DN4617_c0_g3_i2:126-3467(+)